MSAGMWIFDQTPIWTTEHRDRKRHWRYRPRSGIQALVDDDIWSDNRVVDGLQDEKHFPFEAIRDRVFEAHRHCEHAVLEVLAR